MLSKLCLPFSPYRQRPDITLHGLQTPRTAIPTNVAALLPGTLSGAPNSYCGTVSPELCGSNRGFPGPAESGSYPFGMAGSLLLRMNMGNL